MSRGLAALLVLLLAGAAALPPVADDTDLSGRRVRVDTGSPQALTGVVAEANADALVIRTSEAGDASRVSRDAILGLEVSCGYKRHTVHGLVGGALAWAAVIGLYAAFDTLDESGVGEPLFVGGMVAAGGVVGSLVKSEQWERVPLSRVSVSVRPRKRGAQAEVVVRF